MERKQNGDKMYTVFGRTPKNFANILLEDNDKIRVRLSTYGILADPENSWALIETVINWVDCRFVQNQSEDTIPVQALQLYCANHYYSMVKIEGHASFLYQTIHKAREVWPFVLAGLMAMGATRHARLFQKMADWVAINPEAAISNDNEANSEMTNLDENFAKIDDQNAFNILATKWIETWPNFEVIDDDAVIRAHA